MQKKCSKCGTEKELSEFWKNKAGRRGRHSRCKECMKSRLVNYHPDRHRYKKYGTTQVEKTCAVCGIEVTKYGRGATAACMDHCHKTNTVRGTLCNNCNRALGLLKDNPMILKSALEYLEKWANQ